MRYPAVAGAFYERSREALLRQIRECYTHPLGPGRVPQVQRAERRIVGLVVPHAGYAYSGPIAAHSYAALAADGWPSSFVILGPNHHGAGAPLAITNHEWQTPLGSVAADEDLYHRLSKPPLAEISMCGYGPVTAMLTAAKQLGAKGATLLKYGTSSDVSHDAHMAVGYGAIAVYR